MTGRSLLVGVAPPAADPLDPEQMRIHQVYFIAASMTWRHNVESIIANFEAVAPLGPASLQSSRGRASRLS
jgi:hypothetical protein